MRNDQVVSSDFEDAVWVLKNKAQKYHGDKLNILLMTEMFMTLPRVVYLGVRYIAKGK